MRSYLLSVRRRLSEQRGAVALEFVGTFIVFMLLLALAFQAMLAMFALSQANSAARNGARAEVLNPGSGVAAAQSAVSPGLRKSGTEAACAGAMTQEVKCRVTITVPVFNMPDHPAWFPELKVSREAVQPVTEVR